jgi:probable phosphoglycerate mutase
MKDSDEEKKESRRPTHIVLIRHGETEWSKSGKHTGTTEIPLDDTGRWQAEQLVGSFDDFKFDLVLTSPQGRAVETCRLAGMGDLAVKDDDLEEWDYGDYEGRTTPEIQSERPGWSLWRGGVLNGETVEEVGNRVDRVLARVGKVNGDVALFAHGHVLRILTARWLSLPAKAGMLFALDSGTISVLQWEHENHVIGRWNESPCNNHRPASSSY